MNAETSAVCPTCGKDTSGSEEWSTGQCDDCYLADHPSEFDGNGEAR